MTETEKKALGPEDGVSAPNAPSPAPQIQGPCSEPSDVVVAVTSTAAGGPLPPVRPVKKLCDAWLLCFPLGLLGAHNYYLRRYGFGALYTCTLGLLGVGMLVDMVRMPCLVKRVNRRAQTPDAVPRRHLDDAYLLWFPFGLLGFHHFYLRRWAWGVAYFFSLGLLGIGWLIDGCRMKALVDETNRKLQEKADPSHIPGERHNPRLKSLGDAYVLCLSPIPGLLGVHNYYLGRVGFGLAYTFTLGLFGVGWLVDCCRMYWLVKRVNREILEGKNKLKHVDDAYACAFPLGIIGFHQYYLGRWGWGILYTCTLGCVGIGWIIDLFRLPCLVKSVNEEILMKQAMASAIAASPTATASTENASITNPGVTGPINGYGTPANQIPSYMIHGGEPPSYIDVTQGNLPQPIPGVHMPYPVMPMPVPYEGMPGVHPDIPAPPYSPPIPGQVTSPNTATYDNVHNSSLEATARETKDQTPPPKN